MTFPEQILGVPPELVEQGWRLSPSDNITTAWSDGVSPLCRWQYVIRCGVMLARPLRVVAYSVSSDWPITAYAHEGWGGGTAPTPEMVKVWRFWWVDIGNGPRVKDCEVVEYERTPERYWLGPVLLPVRQS